MLSKVLTGKLVFTSLKPPDLSCCTREELKAYFENSYELNESLFTGLKDESALYTCPDRLRLPLVFYYAHTAVVYVNKLLLAGLITERIDLKFETMFETGVDEMSWDDTENYRMGGSYKWPKLDEVVGYRKKVRDLIVRLIDTIPIELPITMDNPLWALAMGMEHERIHIETSSVLIRQLPVHMVSTPLGWKYSPMTAGDGATENEMISAKARDVEIGKPKDFPSYGWDNEYGQACVRVPTFKASKYLVTNKEYLEFVLAGGYNTEKYWSTEGWRWRQFKQAKHPVFWVCDKGCKGGCGGDLSDYTPCRLQDNQEDQAQNGTEGLPGNYRLRLMYDEVALPGDLPVEVNYHEAKAYCKWKGDTYRLPTEAEHHVMRGKQLSVSEGIASDIIYGDNIQANLNFQYGSSTPVNMYGPTDTGFHDVFGNVWEWVEDHFNGLDHFNSHWLYDDFSSPCFDGQHNMMMGGSWISTGDEASRFARFAFRRHFFQHLGFRLAQTVADDNKATLPARVINGPVFVLGHGYSDSKVGVDEDKYQLKKVSTTNLNYTFDSDSALKGILELEFGFRDSGIAVAVFECEKMCRNYNINTEKAVHVGSGTGRGPLELSRFFNKVLGIEPVGRYIDAAIKLKKEGHMEYQNYNIHQANAQIRIKVDDYKGNPDRVSFKQLTWLPNEVPTHDLVLVSHLERAQNPKAWLVRVWEITSPSGIAVVASLSGIWNKKKLLPILGKRMTHLQTMAVNYACSTGRGEAAITVWRRH